MQRTNAKAKKKILMNERYNERYNERCYNERCCNELCYNERRYNESMLQRTVLITIRMLKRTRMNIIYYGNFDYGFH